MNLPRAIRLLSFRTKPIHVYNSYLLPKAPLTFKISQSNDSMLLPMRQISTVDNKILTKGESLFSKWISKVPVLNMRKNKLNALSYVLYESIADGIDYPKHFKEFGLTDSFYSWFAITELHVWMLMVRSMIEGDDGRDLRNYIVHAMWEDVRLRAKKVSNINPSGMKYHLSEFSEQFQAALLAYDEGLQTDDMVLAAAIWRRFFQQRDVDPENLEKLVKYIRKQTKLLENLSHDELFSMKPLKWDSCI